MEINHKVRDSSYSVDFLFLPRMEAFWNLGPPIRHFLNAAIEDWAASYTKYASPVDNQSKFAEWGYKDGSYA